jgi:hypothetical protein
LISRVLGLQPHSVALTRKAFDGGFIIQASNDDLSVVHLRSLMHGQQIAIANVSIFHAVTADA